MPESAWFGLWVSDRLCSMLKSVVPASIAAEVGAQTTMTSL